MNHYPKIAQLAAKSGDYDICIFGHTHEVLQDKVGNTILVNPGEVQGYLSGKATFMVFDTDSREIELIQL